jgi:diguanylate cyclase (GGDEF)-like protein
MPLDINTLLVVTVANLVVLALAAPAVMGSRLGAAARAARWSLIASAASWVCMIASNFWPESLADHLLSTLSIAGFAATHWLLFIALEHWLGPRPLKQPLRWLSILLPVGYALAFGNYALRVGWANILLAAQLAIVARACLKPQTGLRGNWRLVVALGMGVMGFLTFGRGVLGAFTDLYPSFLTPHPWNIAAMLTTSLLPLLINYAILGGWHEEAEVALHQQVITDALTGLFNRRGWQEIGQRLLAGARRQKQPLALLMIDIDWFKKINDTHGHEAGDRALRVIGELLRENRRASDLAARIGGEEFCLLLPGSSAAAAETIDQRLRERLPALSQTLGFCIDFSSGLAMHEADETLERLMQRADNAMYTAKENGRGHLAQAPASTTSG